MRRKTTASVLAAVGLLVGVAAGQQPAPPVDLTDTLIQKALANDPDVQLARAKLALAEAEVAKARQAAVMKLLTARGTVNQRRFDSAVTLDTLKQYAEREPDSPATRALRVKYATAEQAAAQAELELRVLTGDLPKVPDKQHGGGLMTAEALAALLGADIPKANAQPITGPIPDRIRAALDKKVRLGNKGDGIALDAAMEVFKKEAGLDVPIRPTPSPLPRIVLDGEELPIGAWFQMFQDHGGHRDGFAFYVRDYGLLVANRQTAPPDAVTLTEFWRTRPAPAKAPEPKSK